MKLVKVELAGVHGRLRCRPEEGRLRLPAVHPQQDHRHEVRDDERGTPRRWSRTSAGRTTTRTRSPTTSPTSGMSRRRGRQEVDRRERGHLEGVDAVRPSASTRHRRRQVQAGRPPYRFAGPRRDAPFTRRKHCRARPLAEGRVSDAARSARGGVRLRLRRPRPKDADRRRRFDRANTDRDYVEDRPCRHIAHDPPGGSPRWPAPSSLAACSADRRRPSGCAVRRRPAAAGDMRRAHRRRARPRAASRPSPCRTAGATTARCYRRLHRQVRHPDQRAQPGRRLRRRDRGDQGQQGQPRARRRRTSSTSACRFGPQAKTRRPAPAVQGLDLGHHPGRGQGRRRLLVRRLLRRAGRSRSTPPSSRTSRRTGPTCSSPSTRARSPSPATRPCSNQAISGVWAAGLANGGSLDDAQARASTSSRS